MYLYAPPFTYGQLCDLHRRLFSQAYNWAGQERIITISKSSSSFTWSDFIECKWESIYANLNLVLTKLLSDETAVGNMLGSAYANLDAARPFRDGGGRSIRMHLEHVNFCLD